MLSVIYNPALWVVFSYTFVYFFSAFALGVEGIKTTVDFTILIISFFFLATWLPNTFEAFKSGGNKRKFRLALGLALLAAGLAGQRFWILVIDLIGVDPWINTELVSGYIASWLAAGMLLCLSIDAKEDGLVPHLRHYYTGLVGFVCFALGFLVCKILFS